MEHQLFTVRDSKGNCYQPPKAAKTIGEAERMFEAAVNDSTKGNFLFEYSDDFDLYHLGSFDDESGKAKLFDTPRHIVKAIALKRKQ